MAEGESTKTLQSESDKQECTLNNTQTKDQQAIDKDQPIPARDKEINTKSQDSITEVQKSQEELYTQKAQLDTEVTQIKRLTEELSEKEEQLQNQRIQLEKKDVQIERLMLQVEELSRENEVQARQLRELKKELQNSTQNTGQQLAKQQIAQHDEEVAPKSKSKPIESRKHTPDIQPNDTLGLRNLPGTVEQPKKSDYIKLAVEGSTSTPTPIVCGTPAVVGDKVYFKSTKKYTILQYDSVNKTWTEIKHPLAGGHTIMNVDTTLTTVGGDTTLAYSNKLYSYHYKRWLEVLPPMKIKRHSPTTLYTQRNLVVIGGDNTHKRDTYYLTGGGVEILDIETLQWSTTHPLPHQLNTHVSATLHNNTVYLLTAEERYDEAGESLIFPSKSLLFTCSVTTLVKSKKAFWHRHSPLFLRQSCIISIKGHLLAIGGKEGWPIDNPQSFRTTDNIYEYIPSDNLWKVVGELAAPRSDCSTAVLSNGKLMVAGYAEESAAKHSAEFINLFQLVKY